MYKRHNPREPPSTDHHHHLRGPTNQKSTSFMGQSHSATSKDVLAFRQMAVATYRGDLPALQAHFVASTVNYQVSRATYLDICVMEQVQIELLTDSLEREAQWTRLQDEKMDFFAALECGDIVSGDTLLHLAARRAWNEVVEFLLQQPGNNCSEIRNFKGQKVVDVASTVCLQIIFADLQDVDALFGGEVNQSIEEPKIQRFLKSLRRLWPLWMFEGNHEASLLVRAIYDIRSSHPAFSNLVKLSLGVCHRYRMFLTWQGLQLAIHLLQRHELNAPQALDDFVACKSKTKLRFLADFFYEMFEKSNDKCSVDLPFEPAEPLPVTPKTSSSHAQQPTKRIHNKDHKTPSRHQSRGGAQDHHKESKGGTATTPTMASQSLNQSQNLTQMTSQFPLRYANHPRGKQFIEFLDHAMETWIQMVQEIRLLEPPAPTIKVNNLVSASTAAAISTGIDLPPLTPKTPRKPTGHSATPLVRIRYATGQEQYVALPGPETIAKFEMQIWRNRLHPPGNDLEELCTHINGIEEYLQLTDLKA